MGAATDGQLSYGIVFEEGFEFPWDTKEFEGDYEKWWEFVNDYQNPEFNPYTEEGQYKDGMNIDSPEITTYFNHVNNWNKEHPLPVDIITHCSYDYPMYLLAIKHISTRRGETVEINPHFLEISDLDRQKLIDFLDTYKIETVDEPKWWLTSYWG